MTNGVVIVDENMNLITAAFHSNCGGQTINSEAVWSLGLDYLKSVKDTFCYKMPHAVWSKKIDKGRWLQFLKKYNKEIVYDSLHLYCYYSYEMYQREANFVIHQTDIPNKDIRSNFGLRSAYFDILELNQDSVLFKGRGFGHGVGLCQEGAMQMAKYGYNYVKILQHYYTGIHLVDISALEFFREK
jgi:stage II sporulation protein D